MSIVIDILAAIGAFALLAAAVLVLYVIGVRRGEARIERDMATWKEELRDEDDENDKREREL
jgi:hypothetical protein